MSEKIILPCPPAIAAQVHDLIAQDVALGEMTARNLEALSAWRARRAAKAYCPDAWPRPSREYLNFWLEERRELAERWMFKHRCARRWSMQSAPLALPAFFQKQVD